MAKITILGTGGAAAKLIKHPNGGFISQWHSNFLLRTGGKTIALDCGSDFRHAMEEAQVPLSEIDMIYVSHLDDDHIGGLGITALQRYFSPQEKIKLLGNFSTLEHVKRILAATIRHNTDGMKTANDYYDIVALPRERALEPGWPLPGLRTIMVPVPHVVAGPDANETKWSYGLFLTNLETGKKLFWTSDTIYAPKVLMPYWEEADVIFQDGELGFKTNVHAHVVEELMLVPKPIRRKMWLYHNDAALIPDLPFDPSEEFAGFLEKGQEIEF